MSIRDELNDVFQRVFDDDTIQIFDTMAAGDLDDWDSLSHVHLVVAVEKRFNVKFRTAEIAGLKNVGDFIVLIDRKVAATGDGKRP